MTEDGWVLTYNFTTGEYGYAPRGSRYSYNVRTKHYEIRALGSQAAYNVMEVRYEMGPEGWRSQLQRRYGKVRVGA